MSSVCTHSELESDIKEECRRSVFIILKLSIYEEAQQEFRIQYIVRILKAYKLLKY